MLIFFLSFLFSFYSSSSYADEFSLNIQDARPAAASAQKPLSSKASLDFLQQVINALPIEIQNSIHTQLKIEFSDYLSSNDTIQVPRCSKENGADASPSNEQNQVFARSRNLRGWISPVIFLHAGFRPILEAGESLAQRYECGHHNLYRLAVASVVHEIIHLYDGKTGASRNSNFVNLSHFKRTHTLIWKTKNKLRTRSPDVWEFADLRESFAVNFEYFLMDPEYACRKPAMSAFFSELVPSYAPQKNSVPACRVNTKVLLNSQKLEYDFKLLSDLDPKRIYQIHYLFADKGAEMMSRWGHAMYRLVICGPAHPVPGPACLNDIDSHVVVSFRANIDGLVINDWKGLTGKYPSQLFLFPMLDIVNEYTQDELRNLDSTNLDLDEAEKTQFIYSVLESYWGYSGRYFFMTNNCGTEALHLLKSVVAASDAKGVHARTPKNFLHELDRADLVDNQSYQALDAERKTLLFRSKKQDFENAIAIVQRAQLKAGSAPFDTSDFKSFVKGSTSKQRYAFYQLLLDRGQGSFQLSAAFSILEKNAEIIVQKKMAKKTFKIFDESKDPNVQKLKDEALRFQTHAPAYYLNGGYGVPLIAEFDQMTKTVDERNSTIRPESEVFKEWTKKTFLEELDELEAIQENRKCYDEDVSAFLKNYKPKSG